MINARKIHAHKRIKFFHGQAASGIYDRIKENRPRQRAIVELENLLEDDQEMKASQTNFSTAPKHQHT